MYATLKKGKLYLYDITIKEYSSLLAMLDLIQELSHKIQPIHIMVEKRQRNYNTDIIARCLNKSEASFDEREAVSLLECLDFTIAVLDYLINMEFRIKDFNTPKNTLLSDIQQKLYVLLGKYNMRCDVVEYYRQLRAINKTIEELTNDARLNVL